MIPSNTRSTERNGHYCCYCHATMSTSEIWRSLICVASENPSTTIQIQSWWTNARRKCASSRHRRDSPTGKAHLLEKRLRVWKNSEGRSDRVVILFWLVVVLSCRFWLDAGHIQESSKKQSYLYDILPWQNHHRSFVDAFRLRVSYHDPYEPKTRNGVDHHHHHHHHHHLLHHHHHPKYSNLYLFLLFSSTFYQLPVRLYRCYTSCVTESYVVFGCFF